MMIIFILLVPLPILFTFSNNSRLFNIIADPPPTMNLYSTYEFQLLFHHKTIIYKRSKISGLNLTLNSTFCYTLIPNVEHTIIFKHIVESIGYAQSNATISPSIFLTIKKKDYFIKR